MGGGVLFKFMQMHGDKVDERNKTNANSDFQLCSCLALSGQARYLYPARLDCQKRSDTMYLYLARLNIFIGQARYHYRTRLGIFIRSC